ncbi:hypothetical protein SAMN02799630_01695 [Paenibacillus sp. UNCCL117]|uniref:hypothetical protein n=1 Tax=unclassified Paenibacillus TaxID=185978 RepID=UPI00088F45F4|nr:MULTISPECIES: hypothetical protein [unclassified Paenibacillus]SDC91115.1 hypothetical protein SAMN04488602_104181 [Paenibacillus sp. cl123]SFW29001.1 hypothetical protein SAMN02799630_01695 [Paenibacillus sp. UNCCL117]
MAILLPIENYNLNPNVSKSYYEDLRGGTNASVTVNNDGFNPVSLIIVRVNQPVIIYEIPAFNSLTLSVNLLLLAGLVTGAGGTFGTIQVVLENL